MSKRDHDIRKGTSTETCDENETSAGTDAKGVSAPVSKECSPSSCSICSPAARLSAGLLLSCGRSSSRPRSHNAGLPPRRRADRSPTPQSESCTSIDVRQWHREGFLYPGQQFSWSWTRGGEPAGSIAVRVESDAVVLNYRADISGSCEWKSVQQRVPIRLTACHLGGQRPWFVCSVYCNGRYCGRRAAILYGAGELFACRRCYGLSYASQQQTALTSRPGAGSEDQDEARRQCRPAGAIPGKAKGNAPAHISASAGPRGSGNVLLYSAR
jgi:hypothetical protein